MLCCLLIALAGGPFLLWTPRASWRGRSNAMGRRDCCADNRRTIVLVSAMALIVACSAILLLAQPAPFRHICSVLVRS